MKVERKFIKNAWESLPPPEVTEKEWQEAWSGVLRETQFPGVPRSRKAWRTVQIAAVFVAGLALGVLGSRLTGGSVTPQDVVPSSSLESGVGLEGAPKEEKTGAQFCGLQNVQLKRIKTSENSGVLYQMDGETKNGVRIVMTYPEWKSEKNYNGGI